MAGESPTSMMLAGQMLYQLEPVQGTETPTANFPVLSSARGHHVCLTQQGNTYLLKEGCLQMLNGYQTSTYPHSECSGLQEAPLSGHRIDCIGWSKDAYVLALGDSTGSLHFVVPSLNVFHSQVLFPPTDSPAVKPPHPLLRAIQFTQISSSEFVDVIVLGATNVLFVVKLTLGRCWTDALHGDELLSHLKEASLVRRLDLPSLAIKGALASMVVLGSLLVIADSGDLQLSVFEQSSDGTYQQADATTTSLLQGTGIKRCDVSSDGKFVAVLTNEFALGLLLFPSLVLAGIWWGCVEDFVLCENNGRASICFISEDMDQQRCMVLATLPKLEVIYRCNISLSLMLCHGQPSEDCIFVLDETEGSFRLKQLVQAMPQDKLTSLLVQGKFEEALLFANRFNLDCQLVYRKQAEVLNELLCSSSSDADPAPILQCLEQIKDVQFIVQLVLSSSYPTIFIFNSLLKFAIHRDLVLMFAIHYVLQSCGSSGGDVLMRKLICVQRRLVTYNLTMVGKFSSQSWRELLDSSIVDVLKRHLQRGQLAQAGMIWSRHMSDLAAEFSGDTAMALLAAIPDCTPSYLLGAWLLSHYIQFISEHTSHVLRPFLEWTEMRTRLLELFEPDDWPRNALKFVSEVENGVCHSWNMSKSYDVSCSPMAGLLHLKDTLSDLCVLHGDLQCPVSLSVYEKSTREQILFRLLDGIVSADLVPTALQTLVNPYALRHNIPVDQALFQYLKVFLPQTPQTLSDSPWEAKAVAIIQRIVDLELRVMGCVELLRYIRPPWSQLVEDLVQQCLKITHPSIQSLREQYKLLQLNKKLLDYDIHDFNFGDIRKGEKYIRRILSHGAGPAALEDALMVAEMYHIEAAQVYMHYIRALVQQDRVDEVSQLLLSLTGELCKASAIKAYLWSSHLTQFPNLVTRGDYMASVKTIIVCLKVLVLLEADDAGVGGHKLELFQQLLKLAQQFHLCLSYDTLIDDTACYAIFKHVTEAYHRSSELVQKGTCSLPGGHICVVPSTYCQLLMFTQLLGLQETDLHTALATQLVESKQLLSVGKLLNDCTSNSPSAQTIVHLLVYLWRALDDENAVTLEVIEMMSSLASLAVVTAEPNNLPDCVEVYQLCTFLSDVYHRCDVITFDNSNVKSSLHHWLYPSHFNGDSLPLAMKCLLPALKFALIRLPFAPTDQPIPQKPFNLNQLGFAPGARDHVHSLLEVAGHCSHTLKTGGCFLASLCCMAQTVVVYNQSCSLGKMVASHSVLHPAQTLIEELIVNMFNAILSCSHLDLDLGLCLLLQLYPPKAVEVLKSTRQHISHSYSKVISLCQLAINYSKVVKQPGLADTSSSFLCSAQWGKSLGKLGISFTEAFRGTLADKKKVVPSLLRCAKVDLSMIRQYCLDFQIDFQQTLLSYLKVLLTEYQDGYVEKTEEVIRLIEDKRAIGELLTTLTKSKIGLYDYERLTVVLKIAITLELSTPLLPKEGLLLLHYLEGYTRHSEPVQQEVQLYQSILQKPLPSQAYNRLPFHLLLYKKSMEVIGSEVSMDTVDQLIPIVQILGLSGDDFLLNAIRVVTGRTNSSVPFKSFSALLGKFSDLSTALKAAMWLVEHFATGENHTEALRSAVGVARQCLELPSSLEEGEEELTVTVEKLQRQLKISETCNILRSHGLATESYSDLCGEPLLLIEELYKDAPSQNKLCEEIAKLNSLNVQEIKEKLVELWLPVGAKNREMDLSQTSFSEEQVPSEDEGVIIVHRLRYLLWVEGQERSNALLLWRWIKVFETTHSYHSVLRSLHLLLALVPSSVILEVTGETVAMLRDYRQQLVFIGQLETLHTPCSPSVFREYNKESLVKTLLRKGTGPMFLELTTEMALYYKISDAPLWEKLLEELLKARMLPLLRSTLAKLSTGTEHLKVSSLSSITQQVLLLPFEDVTLPLSPDQWTECSKSLDMLPVLDVEVSISTLVTAFFRVRMCVHGLRAALMILCEREREALVNDSLLQLSSGEVVSILEQITDVEHPDMLKDMVFYYLSVHNCHTWLLGTVCFSEYVQFLVRRKDIEGLLIKILENHRVKEAVRLVEVYAQYHSTTELRGMEALKEFLDSHNLWEKILSNNIEIAVPVISSSI